MYHRGANISDNDMASNSKISIYKTCTLQAVSR